MKSLECKLEWNAIWANVSFCFINNWFGNRKKKRIEFLLLIELLYFIPYLISEIPKHEFFECKIYKSILFNANRFIKKRVNSFHKTKIKTLTILSSFISKTTREKYRNYKNMHVKCCWEGGEKNLNKKQKKMLNTKHDIYSLLLFAIARY